MTWWQRALIVSGVFALLWWGITEFCVRMANREAARRKTLDRIMQAGAPPSASGFRRDRKWVS